VSSTAVQAAAHALEAFPTALRLGSERRGRAKQSRLLSASEELSDALENKRARKSSVRRVVRVGKAPSAFSERYQALASVHVAAFRLWRPCATLALAVSPPRGPPENELKRRHTDTRAGSLAFGRSP